MIRSFLITLFAIISSITLVAKEVPTVYVDSKGVMRWSDSKKEASFYGVNYTLPFAHAYRAMGYLGVDRKSAIDRDVYHIARLGLNAYRIHIWDVEISDEKGNLIENDHLDLLDYLIMKLHQRGIRIIITAQTNFGNGYPEKNIDTGAFTYDYEKCRIHETTEAIEAQQRYIAALVNHVNSYTKEAYKDDPYVVGFEINNEPCHPGDVAQTEGYINKMLSALKEAGNKKPVFYNVSHNMHVVGAYYKTAIQGTTYQWYPIGLVAGHMLKGNFLPYVDSYSIPFSNVKGFDNKARIVYEFDPADILYSYMYPAIARTFRSKGFQWITQFAYDPIDMAYANTEYQTHYLNLAYTPNKAVSMAIAAEVAREVKRGEKFAAYPQDTIFSKAMVSYNQDLSLWNSEDKFYYSNSTSAAPSEVKKLQSVIGCGNSPIVKYEGKGVYFIDKLEDGVWRLEVMPDAVTVKDPFEKPSLKKEVVKIKSGAWDMKIDLPDLGDKFMIIGLNNGNGIKREVFNRVIKNLTPGVYLLTNKVNADTRWSATTKWKNITLGEYVMPKENRNGDFHVINTTYPQFDKGSKLTVKAEVVGPLTPDSVIIYTDKISFWNDKNPYYKMKRANGYRYVCEIPQNELPGDMFRYNIVVCSNGGSHTFPAAVEGTPLDWDYISSDYYKIDLLSDKDLIVLVEKSGKAGWNGVDHYVIPEESDSNYYHKSIIDQVKGRKEALKNISTLYFTTSKPVKEGMIIEAGFVTSDGYTYKAIVERCDDKLMKVSLNKLSQTKSALLPYPYPTFLDKFFVPNGSIPFSSLKIEKLEITNKGELINVERAWLE